MFKSFEDAKEAAIKAIDSRYNGKKTGCVVTETKLSEFAQKVYYGFHFNDTDTNGEFVELFDGSFQKKVAI